MNGLEERSATAPQVVSSFLWLNGERVARLGLGVIQTALVARHLGPQWFGELHGSIAFVALFAGVSTLGLDSILARRLSLAPNEAGAILGTALAARAASGTLVTIVLLGLGFGGENTAVRMIVAFTAVAQSLQIGEAWFTSTGKQRKAAIGRFCVFLGALLARIALVATGAAAPMFAVIVVLEVAVSALAVFAWAKRESDARLSLRWGSYGTDLVRESWPVIVSMMSVSICTRIDLVLVSRLLPGETVGAYAAAVRLNELLQFVAAGIPGATIGLLVRLHHRDASRFREVQGAICSTATWIGFLIALGWFVFGEVGARLLFGSQYSGTGSYLRIIAWSNIPVFAGSAWSIFWLANKLQSVAMQITACSALVTLGLSVVLVARFAATGAAWAVVVGQFLPFLLLQREPAARRAFGDMSRAFIRPLHSIRVIKDWLRESRADERPNP